MVITYNYGWLLTYNYNYAIVIHFRMVITCYNYDFNGEFPRFVDVPALVTFPNGHGADLVLAFLTLDHRDIGIGTARGVLLGHVARSVEKCGGMQWGFHLFSHLFSHENRWDSMDLRGES